MRPIENVRRKVFNVPQSEFAEIAGTSQASISRWEKGDLEPSHSEMDRIRSEAAKRGLPWHDSFFFEVPKEVAA